MKNRNIILACVFAIMGVVMILSDGCKKEEDTPAPQSPVFTVTFDSVQLQGGGIGLQFFGKCTNEDVKMTTVTLKTPISLHMYTYDLKGNPYSKNVSFPMQDLSTAYTKELGTWAVTFVGSRTSDNVSFSVNATIAVTGK
jgi:hypothetical protein